MKLPKRIKWRHVQRLYEAMAPSLKAMPIRVDFPERGRVLVLAPHIDDDVIGAGGTLAKHTRAGDPVKIVYFADCTKQRVLEGREAARIIGTDDLEFFEYGPKSLAEHPEIVNRLSKIVSGYGPDLVYLPSLFDRHNDHLAVNNYLSALFSRTRCHFTVCAYEVWTALFPNFVVNISDVVNVKRSAIEQHRSQLTDNDWVEAAISLNRYRGITSGAGLYAEGYMRFSIENYFTLWQRVYGAD